MKKAKKMTKKVSLTVFFAAVIALCLFGILFTQLTFREAVVIGKADGASATPPRNMKRPSLT